MKKTIVAFALFSLMATPAFSEEGTDAAHADHATTTETHGAKPAVKKAAKAAHKAAKKVMKKGEAHTDGHTDGAAHPTE